MKDKIEEMGARILRLGGPLPLQVFIRVKKGVLVRFTNNGVYQNGFQDLLFYRISLFGPEGPLSVESDDCSQKGIQEALRRLRKFISSLKPLTLPSPLRGEGWGEGKVCYPIVREHFPLQVEATPEMAARAIEEGLEPIRREKSSANGYYSAYERFFYVADSRGLQLSHPATAVRFGATITRGAGKGYASFYHPDPARLDVGSVTREAIRLAKEAARGEVSLKPGTYECILSPRAFVEMIEPVRHHFSLELYEEGKSLFSGLLGKRIFSEAFTLREDVSHPKQFGVPFDAEGMPRKKLALVDRGVLKELLSKGNSARGMREHSIYPENLIVDSGPLSLADLFKKVKRGIFLNKIRYHTLVREKELEVTGLATAGCLYIEKGEIVGRVDHLRYHDSLFSILGSVVGRTKEQILLKDGEMGASLFPYLWISKMRVV
ncbi:MAG: TldD/PmbA family protein [Candidatus Omnitrophica bacterium]|nr:TldD/PmbA family protein [Candidatus Omnitrophota bacterium]